MADSQTQKNVPQVSITEIVSMARKRLVRYSNLDAGEIRESFLFHKDCFCGFRMTAGPFEAFWKTDEAEITFHRGGNQIGIAAIHAGSSIKAA